MFSSAPFQLTSDQRKSIASIQGGLKTKARQDSVETINACMLHIPEAWRADPPSDEKARKLLAFFKNEFFTWVNQPACSVCNNKERMQFAGVRGPTTREEHAGMASNVEMYKCDLCGATTSFPRYNNPVTLLTWRKGRCGEWANCFCAMAVAAGFKTRYVVDLTDHVWGEIFSLDQGRWIHCDPCENAFDAPLMYESGWGKKLSWVFAFEFNGFCLDVTRRYSRAWDREMLTRRIQHHSRELTSTLISLAPPIIERSESEEFSKCVKECLPRERARRERENEKRKPEEERGRISGSEEWRKARGELGDDKKEFRERYEALVREGKSANEAAVLALKHLMDRAPSSSKDPKPDGGNPEKKS